MSRHVSVLRSAGFTLAGQLVSRLIGLAFYAVLARALGPGLYGDQAFGAAVGTLAVTLVEPGLNPVLVRDGARDPAALRERLAEALGYKLAALMLVWPLSVGLCAVAGYRGAALWAVLFAGGTILFGALEELGAAALTAAQRLDLEGALRVTSKLFGAGLGLVAIAAGASFELILGAVLLGSMGTGAAGLFLARRAGIHVGLTFHPVRLLARLRSSWALALAGALWMLTLRADQILASRMGVGHEALGAYGAAVKLVEALVLFPGALASAFQPRLSVAWTEGRERCSDQLHLALSGTFAVTLAVAAGGVCLSADVTTLVFGQRFAAAAPLFAIQAACLPLIGLQFLSSHTLVAAGEERALVWSTLANLLTNVTLNVLLVPRLGMAGASWSAVAGGVAGSLAGWRAMRQLGLRPGLVRAAAVPLAGALALVATAMTAERLAWPRPILFVAAGGAYLTVFLFLGGRRLLGALAAVRRRPAGESTGIVAAG